MIRVNRHLARLLVVAALLLPLTTAGALEQFRQAGTITSLTHDKFVVKGVVYRVAPSAKLQSDDASRKRLSDFKKGDKIYFEGKVINGINYVDLVVYEPPTPS